MSLANSDIYGVFVQELGLPSAGPGLCEDHGLGGGTIACPGGAHRGASLPDFPVSLPVWAVRKHPFPFMLEGPIAHFQEEVPSGFESPSWLLVVGGVSGQLLLLEDSRLFLLTVHGPCSCWDRPPLPTVPVPGGRAVPTPARN